MMQTRRFPGTSIFYVKRYELCVSFDGIMCVRYTAKNAVRFTARLTKKTNAALRPACFEAGEEIQHWISFSFN